MDFGVDVDIDMGLDGLTLMFLLLGCVDVLLSCCIGG
jgi:hypothetical protein